MKPKVHSLRISLDWNIPEIRLQIKNTQLITIEMEFNEIQRTCSQVYTPNTHIYICVFIKYQLELKVIKNRFKPK